MSPSLRNRARKQEGGAERARWKNLALSSGLGSGRSFGANACLSVAVATPLIVPATRPRSLILPLRLSELDSAR